MMKKYMYCALAVVLMALTAVLFFYPDDLDGRVLQQHDMQQGIANGQEGKEFHENTGETTRWTNSLFSGMPNFQIAPSYASAPLLNWIAQAYQLWLPAPANLLFIMMTGFFIMGLCMRMRWYVALFGAIAWGFSTYFIIIIGAGHIWKFITLAYIPPTLGGIWVCYRGKYLGGTALAALFGALQLMSNHIQMTYYFCFVILALMAATFISAFKAKKLKSWGIATACLTGAAILAVAANSASLYNTAQYAKETVRGRATYLTSGEQAPAQGADFDYITAWSYGGDETMTLLVPNAKGGATLKPVGGMNMPKSLTDLPESADTGLSYEENQVVGQFNQYFGDQPMTNGPVYVGAFVLALAVLAMFICRGPLKWCLFAVSILSILLAWGHNFESLSRFFVDYFPGYDRFRTVSSILVIAEFTIPVLAMMALTRIIDICTGQAVPADPRQAARQRDDLARIASYVFGACTLLCVLLMAFPSLMGYGLSVAETEQLREAGIFQVPEYAGIIQAVKELRLGMVRSDALRSLIFLLCGSAVVWLYIKGTLRNVHAMVGAVLVICLVDLFAVNKRYVNSENFVDEAASEASFEPNSADIEILKDKDPNFRVLDLDGFASARSSYFHKTIGGYHAAKLTRYNDLIEKQISRNNEGVLNMLNTKYIMGRATDAQGQPALDPAGNEVWMAQRNPGALGNAWWVSDLRYVADDNAEMAALDSLNTATTAVVNKQYASVLGKASADSTATVKETSYAPNKLTYRTHSAKDGVVVFSEIYFPWGWKATIDGKEAPISRVNYVLRALRVPAGDHDIVFTFNPQSLAVTNSLSVAAVIAIYIIIGAALAFWFVSVRKARMTPAEQEELK